VIRDDYVFRVQPIHLMCKHESSFWISIISNNKTRRPSLVWVAL